MLRTPASIKEYLTRINTGFSSFGSVASQMASAADTMTVDLTLPCRVQANKTSSRFMKIYVEGTDDKQEELEAYY